MTSFGLKMMLKCGLEISFLNLMSPFKVAAAQQCSAKASPRKAELARQASRLEMTPKGTKHVGTTQYT